MSISIDQTDSKGFAFNRTSPPLIKTTQLARRWTPQPPNASMSEYIYPVLQRIGKRTGKMAKNDAARSCCAGNVDYTPHSQWTTTKHLIWCCWFCWGISTWFLSFPPQRYIKRETRLSLLMLSYGENNSLLKVAAIWPAGGTQWPDFRDEKRVHGRC